MSNTAGQDTVNASDILCLTCWAGRFFVVRSSTIDVLGAIRAAISILLSRTLSMFSYPISPPHTHHHASMLLSSSQALTTFFFLVPIFLCLCHISAATVSILPCLCKYSHSIICHRIPRVPPSLPYLSFYISTSR